MAPLTIPPPELDARTVWFHGDGPHGLAYAMSAAADWITAHHEEGHIEGVLTRLGWQTRKGRETHSEKPGAIQRWSVGIVQDK